MRQIPSQRRIFTQHFGGDGQAPRGFTQSVTISYGNGSAEPHVTHFTSNSDVGPQVNINNMNNYNMNFGGRNPLESMFSGMPRFFAFEGEEEQPQSRGVSEEFLENLPPMQAGKEADCNICLEKVGSNGNKSCELPCGHAFDKACLATWLKDHDQCPCCRAKLDTERAQPEQEERAQ